MVATSAGERRFSAEAQRLARAVAGDREAVESVLGQLASENEHLRQIMLGAIHASPDLQLWQRLLRCLALQQWASQSAQHRRDDRQYPERIDAAIVQLFVSDELPEVTPLKLAVLREGLTDPDCQVRSTAASLLGLRGDQRAVAALLEASQRGTPPCRVRAIAALAKLGDERGSWAVVEALGSEDKAVHETASQALAGFGITAVPALVEALGSPQRHVRWHAARALGSTKDVRGAARLAAALDDPDSGVRWAAAEALREIGAPAVPAILERLCRHVISEPERQVAYHALQRIGPHEIQERLQPLLNALRGLAASTAAATEAFRLLHEWDDPW